MLYYEQESKYHFTDDFQQQETSFNFKTIHSKSVKHTTIVRLESIQIYSVHTHTYICIHTHLSYFLNLSIKMRIKIFQTCPSLCVSIYNIHRNRDRDRDKYTKARLSHSTY